MSKVETRSFATPSWFVSALLEAKASRFGGLTKAPFSSVEVTSPSGSGRRVLHAGFLFEANPFPATAKLVTLTGLREEVFTPVTKMSSLEARDVAVTGEGPLENATEFVVNASSRLSGDQDGE